MVSNRNKRNYPSVIIKYHLLSRTLHSMEIQEIVFPYPELLTYYWGADHKFMFISAPTTNVLISNNLHLWKNNFDSNG